MTKNRKPMESCRPIMKDALRLCYDVIEAYHIEQLKSLAVGERYDFYEFHLSRIEGKYFDNVYLIQFWLDGKLRTFGELKFNPKNKPEEIRNRLAMGGKLGVL